MKTIFFFHLLNNIQGNVNKCWTACGEGLMWGLFFSKKKPAGDGLWRGFIRGGHITSTPAHLSHKLATLHLIKFSKTENK